MTRLAGWALSGYSAAALADGCGLVGVLVALQAGLVGWAVWGWRAARG